MVTLLGGAASPSFFRVVLFVAHLPLRVLRPPPFGWCCFVDWLLGRLGNEPVWKVKEILVSLVLLGCVVLLLVRCVVLLRSFVLVVVIVFDICDGTPLSGAAFPRGSVVWC